MPEPVQCSRCGITLDPVGESLPAFCPECGAQVDPVQVIHSLDADVDYRLIAPPPDSHIEIVEAANDRLMLSIPAGGRRANSLGCFGILWLLITGAVTAGFAAAAFQQDGPPMAVFLFLSLFWAVGLFMLFWVIKMKYTRGYLFLSRDRAVHQKILFGRKTNSEISLGESSYVHLVESYQENDEPVYRIQIEGTDDKKIQYGTGMNLAWKEWYVETVNQFLAFQYGTSGFYQSAAAHRDSFGEHEPPPICPACGEVVPDQSNSCGACGANLDRTDNQIIVQMTEEVSPDSLPAEFPLSVSKSLRGEWELSHSMRVLADNFKGGGCLLGFGAIWEMFILLFTGGVFMAPGFMKIFMLLFTIPFHLVGIALISAGLFCLSGCFRLVLGPMKSSAFWGVGPLGYTRRFSTESITEVQLVNEHNMPGFKKRRHNSAARSLSRGISCILLAAGKRISVTSGLTEQHSRRVAGVIRYCLHDLGHRLQDE